MFMEYIKSFIYGIIFGLPFCLAVGPVFFLLIQAGVNKGVKFALAIAYGVILADTVLINLTYFFVDRIHNIVSNNYTIIQILISILLFSIGIISIFKKNNQSDKAITLSQNGTFLFFINGFVLDVFNPSNIFVWIGVNSEIIVYNKIQHFLFYTSSLLTIAFLMIAIAFLCNKIQPYLNSYLLKRLNISLGVIYIAISITIMVGGEYFHHLFS